MTKFYGERNGEASGYSLGEAWHVKFNDRGEVTVKDEAIAEALRVACEHPDSPIRLSAKAEVSGA